MHRTWIRPSVILALSVLVAFGPARQASAQTAAVPDAPKQLRAVSAPPAIQTIVVGDQNADRTRDEFMRLLERYPPSLGRVLKLDPTLLSNQAYLAPYPALGAFLTQHPDIPRSPAYFLERISASSVGYREPNPPTSGERMWESLLNGLGFVLVFGTIVSLLAWLVKSLIDYRRWGRLAKVQADAHTKLLGRFTANDELIAYVQSPAGSQFLQSAPIALDPGGRRLGAPFNRILWSVQVGLVLAMAGVGLRYVSGSRVGFRRGSAVSGRPSWRSTSGPCPCRLPSSHRSASTSCSWASSLRSRSSHR